jgi:hypothetical protein
LYNLKNSIARFYPTRTPLDFSDLPNDLKALDIYLYMAAYQSDTDVLRGEIAAAAARMIAEDGSDYQSAKRKAAKQILGDRRIGSDMLPDNAQIEDEVRTYNQLFFADTQPARLLHLRKLALKIMEDLAQFRPYLIGAVLNGTAGEHSDIHLQLFSESAKDVEIYLINKNVNFEVSEAQHLGNRSKSVEVLSFMWKNEGVHLALYEIDDMRNALKSGGEKRLERANADTIRELIAEEIGS